jgi:Ca-activated chloride channel family protein
MTRSALPQLTPDELRTCGPVDPEGGFGALQTSAGNLPLRAIEITASITGLTTRVQLLQRFTNPHGEPLEATYIFPLPDRGAVTALKMTADGHTVVARLRERAQARAEYDAAIAAGQRASIAEEDRPDVFTLRVGNILPGEDVTVELTVVGVMPVADGAATFRFPLVVAPRYVPGEPLAGDAVGAGYRPDTDAVPDASRITPPVLLPGFPHPVRLDATIEIDPGGLEFGTPKVSLHAVQTEGGTIRFEPGQRVDRDIVLRIPLREQGSPAAGLVLVPDADGASAEGTFELTVLPPELIDTGRARDVVLLLDRSGSMSGWKMVAARRAAARIVDTLTDHDRFAVLAFDHEIERPTSLPVGLVPATDRHRFRAVEFLAGLDARGGTELAEPLDRGLGLLRDEDRSREQVLVLVTDGQVGNEDQLLRAHGSALSKVRVHTVGIDRAVNAGFLGRLASIGGGRCELVESEDRLDEAMSAIHRRIGTPLVTDLALGVRGMTVAADSITPARMPDLFSGVPLVLRGRYREAADPQLEVRGVGSDGQAWAVTATGRRGSEPAITAAWARGQVRELEDRYVIGSSGVHLDERSGAADLERQIVQTSLRFGVLCRFTAFIAVDERVVTDGTAPRTVVQPIELPSGWEMSAPGGAPSPMPAAGAPRRYMSGIAPMAGPMGGATPFAPAAMAMPTPMGAPPGTLGGAAAGFDEGAPDGDDLSELLDRELARLRARPSVALSARRDALADLGSRLTAVADRQGPQAQVWIELLDLLGQARIASSDLDELERRVIELLEQLRAMSGSGSQSSPGGQPWSGWAGKPWRKGENRPAFWKHHPDR